MQNPQRIIKKYPNRRLYDTEISAYVTLGELRQLVTDNGEFQVVDAKTGQDITHNILLQIITEQEHSNPPMFSNQFLAQLIRLYGNSMQVLFADFLQSSMSMFTQQQKELQDRFNKTTDPFQALNALTSHNLELWRKMQNLSGTPGTEDKDKRD